MLTGFIGDAERGGGRRAGGGVEFVTLERSYHVATQDYDRDLINERSLQFISQVTGR